MIEDMSTAGLMSLTFQHRDQEKSYKSKSHSLEEYFEKRNYVYALENLENYRMIHIPEIGCVRFQVKDQCVDIPESMPLMEKLLAADNETVLLLKDEDIDLNNALSFFFGTGNREFFLRNLYGELRLFTIESELEFENAA